jgi:hypothetical protein
MGRYIFIGNLMPISLKFTLTLLLSFLLTSVSVATLRTNLLDVGCDPKFKCLYSLSCLITPIIICTLILGVSFLLVYWLSAKSKFKQINKHQILTLSVIGSLFGLLVFGYPLATIIIIYGGYYIVWLPLSIILSFIAIQLSKKYNKSFKQDK